MHKLEILMRRIQLSSKGATHFFFDNKSNHETAKGLFFRVEFERKLFSNWGNQ